MASPLEETRETLSGLDRADEVCLRFEDEWRAGRRPAVGEYLQRVPVAERDELLVELLLLEWDYLRRAGESFFVDEYRQRFADRPGVVEQCWRRWSDRIKQTETTTHQPSTLALTGYEQLTAVGKGGMGVVYRAWATRLERWVALKQLHLGQATPDRLDRFRREARALARLSHPHVVTVYDFAEHDGQPVLVMEYVAGGTLEAKLGREAVPADEAARLVAILAWAVQAAHDKGIVHRDLKPANVLLAEPKAGGSGNVLGGFPKVSDFGLATLGEPGCAGTTTTGTVLGTPAYMSPEQAAGKTREVGPATDVWALGVILYRCLTGRLPFAGDSVLDTLERIKTMQLRPVREVRPEVPADLEAICLTCLQKEAGSRPTAAELARRLVGTSCQLVLSPEDKLAAYPYGWRIAGALAALVLLVAVAAWALRGKGDDPPDGGAAALRILHLRVQHYERQAADVPVGPIGGKSMEALFDDRVIVQVEFSEPAYCYILGLNTDGKEQLLWPRNEAKADAQVVPPLLNRVQAPPPPTEGKKQGAVPLNDDKRGGLQAFVVAASRRPLPAYAEWKRGRPALPWARREPAAGVWRSDGRTLDAVQPGDVRERGEEVELEGQPPLLGLCGWARGGGVESVEAVCFPVYKREKR